MKTNLFNSMNLIRRGSGASLNLFRYAAKSRDSQGVVTATSYGASDEHPISIRSASDGSKWNTRGNLIGVWKYAAMVAVLLMLGVGNAWGFSHDTHTATLNVNKGTGSGTVYASTSGSATSGSASASFNCGGEESGQHTGTLYAYATPASGYTFLGWTTSASSSAGADNSNPKGVAFDVSSANSSQTLYAHFVEKAKVNITFVAPSNGTYTIKVNGGSAETVSSADVVKNNVEGVVLTATPASGYAFAGWYKLNSAGEFVEDLSIASPYNASFTTSETIKMGARFVPTTLGKFILKGSDTQYYGLKMATIAAGGSGTIVPVAEETLVDGSDLMPFDNGTYTIKAGATLLIPYSSANEVQTKPKDIAYNSTGWTKALSIYKKLKLGEGVNINVLSGGVVCVGGQLVSYNGGNPSAYPIGACGVIDMSSGGHIELNGTLYCWGFIKGQDMDQGNNTTAVGTITANNGAVIWEDFAVGDWRGGTACSTIAGKASSWKFFPFQSYTIQNVEVPTTYKYGSTLSNYTNVYGGGGKNEGTFSLIGNSNTLFLLKDASSFVRKWYDPTTDLVNYELSGTAQLDALNVDAGITTVSSSSYNLPISSNMQIVLTNCNMTISKPMIVQPGAVIEIKNDATLTLASNAYIFDVDNWGMYCNGRYFYSMDILTNHKNRGTGTSKELLDDATLIVDGTLNVTGKLYTTAGGADIMGNGGGSVKFSSLGGSGNIVMCTGVSTNENVAIAQANMHNEDDSYTQAEASTFYNVNSRWFITGKQNINSTTHVYDEFKFISSGAVSGTGGTTTTTPALYGEDKTGLVAGMKWCNVVQDATCNVEDATHSVIYNATQDLNGTAAANIRYTYQASDWLQLLKTETEGIYGGSDNSLYALDGCAVNSLGSVDENCLYTINDVKKALVDGHFVALEKNTEDEAWHDVANTTNYYISFAGCTWHPATKYTGEEKAYIVEGGDYIWYNNDWLLVEREDPFFFDYNEQNVKRYYEYANGAWVLAEPRVRVVDAIETRDFYKLPEAITVASGKKNATITILKDISGINTRMTFTAANTTCTLDLNGHTVSGAVPFTDDNNRGLLKINASGTTFTITDNSAEKEGRLENICNQNKVTYTVHLMAGTLNVEHGTIHAENPAQYASKAATVDNVAVTALTACGARGIQVNAAQKLNVTGGRIEAHATRNAYGIVASGNAANTTQVTITNGEIYAEAPYGAYGISCSGKLNISGGLVEAKLNDHLVDASYAATNASNNLNKHAECYAIHMSASANKTASSCFYGTLTVTGGTIKASSDLVRSYTSNVAGIRMYYSVAGMGNRNFASTSGTNAQQACAIGSVKNAEILVQNNANYGYGIMVYGHYNSYNKTNSIFKVENTTIDVKAYNYAYGVYALGAIDGTTGECVTGDVELTNCTVKATAEKAAGSYAAWVYSGATTIYQNKQANYYGEYAAAAKMKINGGTYTAWSKTTTAYAVGTSNRAKSTYGTDTSVEAERTLGGNAEAYPTLIINGGTFNATSTTTTARGVSSGGNTTINDATFNVVAGTTTAYGLYALAGKLTATNVIVNDTAKGRTSSSNNNAYAYGVLVDCAIPAGNTAQTGFAYAGDVELNNCIVNAVAASYDNARALYVNATNKVYNWTQFKADSTSNKWATTTYNAYKSVFPCTVQGRDSIGYAIAATATVNGGTFTAKAGRASAYGAVSTQTSVPANKEVTASPEMTLKNATFSAQTGTSTTAYGVQAGGPTLIEGCTITATAGNSTKYQSTASGVRALDKTTTIKNSTITASATDKAYGLEGYVEINGTHGYCWHGEFDLSEAGTTAVTAEAKTKAKTSYAIFLNATKKAIASGNFAGDYATAANATINGGTYVAKFNTSGSAYVISLGAKQTQGSVIAQPEVEVLDGFFNGASAELGTAGVVGHMQLKGGYFVHNTNLATYAVAPKSVWTLPTTHEHYNPYKYKITEHYTVTFMNGTTQLQQNDLEAGNTPAYTGTTPTKTNTAEYTYTFDGWSTTDGGNTLASLPAVSANAIYYAHYAQAEKKYAVSVSAGANGSVSPASVSNIGCETASGDITATPNVGYSFSGWTLPEGVSLAEGYELTSNPVRIHATAADKTITANFEPRTDINYTVKHWQQNIKNDEYTEVTADQQTLQGTTATATAAAAKSYTGFTAQPIDQVAIAGDGLTVVNVYYDRNTYAITWVDGNGTTIKTDANVKYDATPVYTGDTPTKTATTEKNYMFTGWSTTDGGEKLAELPAVSDDATYYAHFDEEMREYTITWKNIDGTVLTTTTNYWDEEPAYPMFSPTPTYIDNEYHYIYKFEGWEPEIHAVNSDVNVYTAKYRRINDLDVPGEQTVSVETTVSTTKVRVSGRLVVASHLTTDDLILEGSLDSSGQIENNGTVTATNVYYDLSNGTDGFKARTWYAIAVPWQVDVPAYNQAGCGVYLTNDGVNFTQQELGASFDLLYYDGALRAAQGHSSKCWKLVEKDAAEDQIIYPGRAYMIYLTSDAKTIRFKKKAGKGLFTTETHVQPYSGNGNAKDANWNGIANPATFHAYLNTASSNQGQVYIAGEDRYEAIADMSTRPLVVGQPVFVQATDEKTVVACATKEEYASHAPRRMSSSEEEKIMAEVRIAPVDKAYTDRLYVGVEEVKADEYEIGKDLAKAGVSTKVAQMWVNRYNTELCINSMELVNNRAEYPLTISAPAAGEYTIGMEPSSMAENQTYVLYLTLNGQPIWNLNYNAYTATLEKGRTEGYGLRLVYNAPQIATGIEETTIENGELVRKVMIDEKVYILRGGQVYSIDGQLVK